MVGDTILTWVVGRGSARMHRGQVPRGELARSTERLRWALERGIAPVAGRELDRLARWLLHPVEPWIGPHGGEVTVVTDGELASIPFGALPARSGRRWVEDHPLRRAPSLADSELPRPAAIHAHDWQAALASLFVRHAWSGPAERPRTVLTIHNLGYHGAFPPSVLGEHLRAASAST